jgi:CRISPR-associated protein Cmr6
MPVLHRTGQLLGLKNDGVDYPKCENRSLILERLADPSLKEARRTAFFRSGAAQRVYPEKSDQWLSFLLNELKLQPDDLLYAQLQSRMMVNMAGGVMENAGLCLDRLSGLPYIPGSAVRGCARRMAIQLLIEARKKIEAQETDQQQTEALARFLADVALVFGWGLDDWKSELDIMSDFVYAIGASLWPKISIAAGRLLLPIEAKGPSDFGHFAGRVSFLPAYPIKLSNPDLELDVVTSHHPKYYSGGSPTATDTEDPVPVTFLAVAPGARFQFAVLPFRGERASFSQPESKLHLLAQNWLSEGLETFGIGAKTNAGYGWFTVSSPCAADPRTEHGSQGGTVVPTLPVSIADKLINKWRGKLSTTGNFAAALPEIAAVEEVESLKRIFDTIFPEQERRQLRKNRPYWQSFTSGRQGEAGKKILARLGITLQ